MPCIGYALTHPHDTAEAVEALAVAARKAYDDLGIAKTGAIWNGFLRDRTLGGTKAIKRFRLRTVSMRIFQDSRPGDCIIFPEYTRGFRHRNDFMVHARRWIAGNVRVIVLDIGFDSANEVCRRAIEIMRLVYNNVAKAGVANPMKRPKAKQFIGRPMMGLEIRGRRGHRHHMVVPDLYELGFKVREWQKAGWEWQTIANHLYDLKVFREPRQNLSVVESLRQSIAWEAESLKKLAANVSKIEEGVLDGRFRLPRDWRPEAGPLKDIPRIEAVETIDSREPEEFRAANDVGRRIRAIRRKAGMAQIQLAKAAGMRQGSISDIEKGIQIPLTTSLIRLAQALGVPVRDLQERRLARVEEPDLVA